MTLDLHAFGRRLSADIGTPGYGIPLNKSWYRHTLAHNTVLVDETAQPPATGELVRFAAGDASGYGVADARVNWPSDAPAAVYAGVTARRCLLWKASPMPYFIDLVGVRCPEPRQIDLAWHHLGDLELPGLLPMSWTLDRDGYRHLSDLHQLAADEWQARWQTDGAGTACWALNPPGALTIAARGPSNPAAETRAVLLRRVTAAETWFVAVFEPFAGEPAIREVRWLEPDLASGGRLAFVVAGAAGEDAWLVSGEGAGKAAEAGLPQGATVHRYALD